MPTALIVEDEPEANRLLSMLIQLRGYRTVSAFTGGEALETVGRQPPDIVFLDLMLPDTTGYEVCRALKTRKATSLIPVVMVSARIADENRRQGFGAGADDYIPKPYTPDQIFRAMAVADAWRRDADRRDAEGEIRLDACARDEPLRQLAQLRNLLVARSSLDPDAVRRVGAALEAIAADAGAWGRAHGAGVVATLGYRLNPDRVVLSLRDEAGWLGGEALRGRWAEVLQAARFDQVDVDETGHHVTLLKRFRVADGQEAG
jgi:CheY-like chemotaxis protein